METNNVIPFPSQEKSELLLPTPSSLNESVTLLRERYLPEGFDGKLQKLLRGKLTSEFDESNCLLNVTLFNPDIQFGPNRLVAKISFRDLELQNQDFQTYQLKFIMNNYRLMRLSENSRAKPKLVDCKQPELDLVAEMLDRFEYQYKESN